MTKDQVQEHPEDEETTGVHWELPGERLREARQTKGLTIDEVAVRLHLNAKQVAALEGNDYGRFAAPLFVSGYLRNYARLLCLPEEPIVEAYERLGVSQPPILSGVTTKMPKSRLQPRQGRKRPAVRLALIIMLSSLFVIWFLQDGRSLWDLEGWLGMGPGVPGTVVEPAPEPGPGPDPQQENSQAFRIGPEDAAGGVQGPVHEDTIILTFNEDSWVELTDASGKQLLFRLGSAGETVAAKGLAPFDLLLGYAPGVTISYNGKTYRSPRSNSKNVSVIRLGE